MLSRSIQTALESMMQQYPVVTITGPRQSGKSTLVKTLYPGRPYYSLENPDVYAMIHADPRNFMKSISLRQGVILDEVQRFPALLSYIQGIVDDNRIPGSFTLTGSHQLALSEVISQSLAGRTAVLELLPLSLSELAPKLQTTNEYLLSGFFPAVYEYDMDPIAYARNYIKTYVERDVRQLIHLKDLNDFQRFLRLCVGRIASTMNRESLGNDVGVSQNTIKHWLTVLDATYVTFQLKPYFENFGKRVIKAPKLYFTDVGIASYLLEIRSTDQMNFDKMRGALFENMVVMEIVKHQTNSATEADIYFYRDSNQNEVDVILSVQGKLVPVEIKSTATFHPTLLKNLLLFQKLAGDRASTGYLIYDGDLEPRIGNIQVLNFRNSHKIFLAE